MEFVALGDTDAIGASCLFLQVNDTGIILDAGADPEEEGLASLPQARPDPQHGSFCRSRHYYTRPSRPHRFSSCFNSRVSSRYRSHDTGYTAISGSRVALLQLVLQRRKLREGSSFHQPLFSEEELEMHSYLYLTHELEDVFSLKGMRENALANRAVFQRRVTFWVLLVLKS